MFAYFLFSILSAYLGIPAIFNLVGRDEPLGPESCKGQLTRTLFGIVWGCVSTTILCAWTAVHLNVPPRSKLRAGWNRLRLMFWMIVAPELVLAWAVRQLFAAKDIRDAYNNSREGKFCKKTNLGLKSDIQTGITEHTRNWIRWTLVQGHLLGMGGFTLVDPDLKGMNSQDQKSQVLTNDKFEELIQVREFELFDVTESDIQDRSKGDVLFKVITILQTTWFIIQCVARGPQQLGLTELELVTLALASLNAATFAIWWYKPLGVQEPVRIYLRIETPKIEYAKRENPRIRLSMRDVISKACSKGWEDVKGEASATLDFLRNPCENGPIFAFFGLFIEIPLLIFYIITFPIFLLFPLAIILLLRIIEAEPASQNQTQSRGLLTARIIASLHSFRYLLSSAVAGFISAKLEEIFVNSHEGLPNPILSNVVGHMVFSSYILLPLLFILLLLFVIFLIPFRTLLFLVSFVFNSVFGIVTTSTIPPGASHVPSFYAPITQSDRWSRMVVFALFGVIFGGIHCIGWYFKYPTTMERTLWRATSLAITVIPLIVAPIDFLLSIRLRNHDLNSCRRFERMALLMLYLIMTILLFIYVPVRLSLIAQALLLLRNQPPNVFVAVDWTKYIPHLFSQ